MNIATKIPVFILSGFLGSGKTTVLLNMLQSCKEKGQHPGIILNELGEENVEGHLFEDKKVVELLNGCICCTIQDDLKDTLDKLITEMDSNPLDVLFIEGTGVANPLEIQEALLSKPYIDQFEIMSIITVLDASHYLEYQSVFSSSAEVRKLMKEQMICGSILLLNKTDLITSEQLDKVIHKIMKISGNEKEIMKCTHGQVDTDMLFKKRYQSILISKQHSDTVHDHHHHSTVQAMKVEDFPSLQQKAFEKWLSQLPNNVLRGKGFVEIKGFEQLYSFQYASKKTTFTPVPSSLNKKPIVILIGVGLDNEQMNNHCKQLLEGTLK
ncbi:CobW family GTP-binding protein [Psychrobacillus sp. NPDC058041]|uniref:CobW family GTP-binding protein n=1 Tax=Psychrobacillus sp. NPDC058041 TaxID=3346310 RepID=UPI0036D887DB